MNTAHLILIIILIILIILIIWKLKNNSPQHSVKAILPHTYVEPQPDLSHVDVVYSWIDGSNSDVVDTINHYIERDRPTGRTATPNRFRSTDELKYSLRSLHQFGKWVRNIYILTSLNKVPSWFDEEIGLKYNIYFIDDSTLFPEDTLPIFNSLAKETVMHRIPNLSEKFLYFNDDVFMGRMTTESDFVHKDGKVKIFVNDDIVPKKKPEDQTEYFKKGLYYTRGLLLSLDFVKDHPKKDLYDDLKYKHHVPDMHLVSEDREKWVQLQYQMEKTSRSRFRTSEQVYDNSLLDNYWKFFRGKAEFATIHNIYVYLSNDLGGNRWAYNKIRHEKPKVFCLNDGIADEDENTKTALVEMQLFLEQYFPKAAPWEI